MKSKRTKIAVYAAIFLWLVVLVAGTTVFWRYENKSGVAAAAPIEWPADSRIQRATDRSTLVMLVHPHCPCSRASMIEIARLMARVEGRVTAYVIFIKPDGVDADWEKTDTWASAAKIPGVSVIRDEQGLEARRFDAHTSGQTMLYDKNGKLLFSGGITLGRGQEGDSAGGAAIASLVEGETSPLAETNVFGCPLFANDSECRANKETSNAKPKR